MNKVKNFPSSQKKTNFQIRTFRTRKKEQLEMTN
jgi:hypothetical protein